MGTKPKTLILRSPGTNCDVETAYAFELAGSDTVAIHINELLLDPDRLLDYQILCLPGGFSYGDDIAAGKVLSTQMENQLADHLREFHGRGNLILGICNGFQVLIKSGLLFANEVEGPPATLTWNASGRYINTWVPLTFDDKLCVFLHGLDELRLPIAHAEGRFVAGNQQALQYMEVNHQLAVKYGVDRGKDPGPALRPENPNGSMGDVAGVCDETGRIFGLMPHPERYIDPTQHPSWTRNGSTPGICGLAVFENAVRFFQ